MHGSTVYYAWPFSDSDAASPQQTQTNNDASGCPQRVAGRPPLPIVRVTALYLTNQKGFGTAPTESHTGDKWKRCLLATKKSRPTALCVGDARKPFWPVRCRPAEGAGRLPKRTAVAGVPLVRFDHSLFKHNSRLLRAISHYFFMSRELLETMSSI